MKDKLNRKQRWIWLIPIAILLTAYNQCKAQDNISIGIYQDAKLLFLGDDRGNEAFKTIDTKLDISLQGYQLNSYYFSISINLEYANLKGGDYSSLLITPNWTFNQQIQNIELSAGVVVGLIHRWKMGYATYGLSGDISYKITPKLKLSALGQIIKRSDLAERWGTKGLSLNFYIGLKYNLK
jgi:hypothetical protein